MLKITAQSSMSYTFSLAPLRDCKGPHHPACGKTGGRQQLKAGIHSKAALSVSLTSQGRVENSGLRKVDYFPACSQGLTGKSLPGSARSWSHPYRFGLWGSSIQVGWLCSGHVADWLPSSCLMRCGVISESHSSQTAVKIIRKRRKKPSTSFCPSMFY